jgi:hypothetical protein
MITFKHTLYFFVIVNLILWGSIGYFSTHAPKSEKSEQAPLNIRPDHQAKLYKYVPPSLPPTESWFSKNWPFITTVLTTIPTIVIKWKEMFDKFKKRKRYAIRS